MAAAARSGVDNAGGGLIIANTVRTVFVNNSPIALEFDAIASHGTDLHAASSIVSGSITVIANGMPVARLGDPTTCGHPIATGSPNVIIGG